jgi:WbqC-like protein family
VTASGDETGCSVAVMQPYFFPYLGYFQLLAHVDVFVVCDDTQYVKQSWMNRNRILERGAPAYLTLPVASGCHRQLICKKRLHAPRYHQPKLLARIRHAYHAAPHLDSVAAFLDPLFAGADETIASFNVRALRALKELLGLRTRLVLASERAYPRCRTAQERVIRICLEEGGSRYVNPIRARSLRLYEQAAFTAAGLDLSYLSTNADIRYDQNCEPFVPDLSVIDVLMFNSPAQTRELLDRFVLT